MTGFLNINAFCAEYAIPRSTLYRLIATGIGPQVTHIGRRALISRAAAEEWRAKIDGNRVETARAPTWDDAQRGTRR
jgi:predicted DNA-binding transcriptional regulator AlpA